MSTASQSYTASDIVALEGLEPVRKRPSMYKRVGLAPLGLGDTRQLGRRGHEWSCERDRGYVAQEW
jgi:hypothetical protein